MENAPPPPDAPKSLFQRLGAALPIALTAIATAFAGLSSSEMSRAMFWRSVAAQDQAKAASQWSFAGFKRDRAMMAENTAATLRAIAGYPESAAVPETPAPAVVEQVRKWMQAPDANPPPAAAPLQLVLNALLRRGAEPETVKLAGKIPPAELEAAIDDGHAQANGVEGAWDAEAKAVREAAAKATKDGRTAVVARQSDADARRYRAESTMNFWVGYLYEVRVKASVFQSDRHRARSENFFYAMLGAQVGATVASLALARRTGNALWFLAGIAGAIAVAFGAYVYLTF